MSPLFMLGVLAVFGLTAAQETESVALKGEENFVYVRIPGSDQIYKVDPSRIERKNKDDEQGAFVSGIGKVFELGGAGIGKSGEGFGDRFKTGVLPIDMAGKTVGKGVQVIGKGFEEAGKVGQTVDKAIGKGLGEVAKKAGNFFNIWH